MTVTFAWVGAVTDDSAVVSVGTDAASVRLVASTSSDLSSPFYSSAVVPDLDRAKLVLSGLTADTVYHFGVEEDSVLDAMRGTFSTFPTDGEPASFEAVFGSCHNSGVNALTFDAIRVRNPTIFVNTGDFHYEDITSNVEQDFLDAYALQLTKARPGQMYRSVATDYMPDDHDYGPDNSDRFNPSIEACKAAYQRMAPHYPLADVDDGLYHQFRIGRVVFIVTDSRHNSDPPNDPITPTKTRLGADQKAWLKASILAAITDGAPLVVWVFTGVWHSAVGQTFDTMSLFPDERRELADWVAEQGIAHKLLMVSGDSHQPGLSDGTNADYSTNGGGGFPVMLASPLHAGWHNRGGPWSQGPWGADLVGAIGMYGVIRVTDPGGDVVSVEMEIWNVDTTSGVEALQGTVLVSTEPKSPTVPVDQLGTFNADTFEVFTLDGADYLPATVLVRDEPSNRWATAVVRRSVPLAVND